MGVYIVIEGQYRAELRGWTWDEVTYTIDDFDDAADKRLAVGNMMLVVC